MTQQIRVCLIAPALAVLCAGAASGQPFAYEDVVRNLRHPDPEVRLSAVRLLRDAKYLEAIVPIAPLVADPVNEVQLEAMAAELSFFLVDDVPSRRRVKLFVEVRSRVRAAQAFAAGPLAVWPRAAPQELVVSLLKAIDDEQQQVRLEAIYTLGVVGAGAVVGEHAEALIKALDHYDPAVRAAAARVIGRLRIAGAGEALITAMNDSRPEVRHESMRALGALGEATAVTALGDQLSYHGKGEGARAALDGLARIAHPSSVPQFVERLTDRDPWLRRAAAEGLGRAGHAGAVDALRAGAAADDEEMVRAAMVYALVKIGQERAVRLADFLDGPAVAPQVQSYLIELGPATVGELAPRLLEPDEQVRRHVADTLGAIGDASTIATLTPLLQDRDRDVVKAAGRAIERIKQRAEGPRT